MAFPRHCIKWKNFKEKTYLILLFLGWHFIYIFSLPFPSPPLFPFLTGFKDISANAVCLTSFLCTYHPMTVIGIMIWVHDGSLALMITPSLLSSYWLFSLLSFLSYYCYHHKCSGMWHCTEPSFELLLNIYPRSAEYLI